MKEIEVSHLTFGYNKEQPVLKDISFSIEKGSYVSILGHNGSGKSTLAKLLIGLLKKDDGAVSIGGLELNKDNQREIRKKCAIVFQNPDNQFIGSTVEDDIAFGLENRQVEHDEMVKIVHEYAEKVGMIHYLDKEPGFLSGGQKQRVALAGALSLNPDLLILDESTSMLDPKGKREVNELINKMRQVNKDLTILSITHDIEESVFSDEIIILNKGEIAAFGPTKEILSNGTLLKQFNIEMPLIYQLNQLLKEENITSNDISNIEEAIDLLCK